jgi:hypothetical protein
MAAVRVPDPAAVIVLHITEPVTRAPGGLQKALIVLMVKTSKQTEDHLTRVKHHFAIGRIHRRITRNRVTECTIRILNGEEKFK